MHDAPDPSVLLDLAARFLRNELLPTLQGEAAFKTRVTIGALELVGREIAQDPKIIASHRQRIVALLGDEAGANPEKSLAGAIRGGAKLDRALLMDVLWNMTLAKLAVDQPRYAGGRPVQKKYKER